MDKIITKYEYDEKGRVVKQTVYKNNKIESEFIVTFDDKNNTKVEVGYNITTFTQYDKDGDISIYVQEEAIGQKVKEDGYTYTIHDGYFTPTNNGYIYNVDKNLPLFSLFFHNLNYS